MIINRAASFSIGSLFTRTGRLSAWGGLGSLFRDPFLDGRFVPFSLFPEEPLELFLGGGGVGPVLFWFFGVVGLDLLFA